MKKKITALILSLFLFSSCSFENAPPIDENENINFNPEIAASNSGNSPAVMNYSYEITVTNDVSNLKYNGEQLSLDIELENYASEAEIGFVLVSDGQPVETSVDGKTEIVHIIKLPKEEIVDFTAIFTPYGKKGETIAIHPVSILEPGFSLSENEKSFMFFHSIITTAPIKLKMEQENINNAAACEKWETISYTDSKVAELKIEEQGKSLQYKLFQEKSSSDFFNISEGKGSFKFLAYDSGTNANIRVSFFLNSRPVTFNGGCSYLNTEIVENYISCADIAIDEKVSEYDSVYALVCPYGEDFMKEVSMAKTPSYSFLKSDNSAAATSPAVTDGNGSLSSENTEQIMPLGFDENGNLFGQLDNNDLCLLDLDTFEVLKRTSPPRESGTSSYAVLPYGIVGYSSSLGSTTAKFYSSELEEIYCGEDTVICAVSPNYKKIFYGDYFDCYAGDIGGSIKTVLDSNEFYVSNAVFISDDTIAFSGGNLADNSISSGAIGIYNISSDNVKWENCPYVNSEIKVFKNGVMFTENRSDGQTLYIVDKEFNIRKIAVEAGESNNAAISPNGKYIATCRFGGGSIIYRLYEAESGNKIGEIEKAGFAQLSIAVDNDGTVYGYYGKNSSNVNIESFELQN